MKAPGPLPSCFPMGPALFVQLLKSLKHLFMNISGPLTHPELDHQGTETGAQTCLTFQPVADRTS